jgi:two-component system heavy metal sensor histidine kinase CusS
MRRAPLSITLRLALLFSGIAVMAFVAVGAYLYQTLATQMSQRDDVELLNKVVVLRQVLRTLPPGAEVPNQLIMVLGRVIGQGGVLLRVSALDGSTLVQTTPSDVRLPDIPPVPAEREPRLADIVTWNAPNGLARAISATASTDRSLWQVTLTRERSDRLALLKRYAFDLVGALVVGAMLATALGFIAVRSAMRPLNLVTGKADNIHAHRLNCRLSVNDAPLELRALSVAFNAMLDRLEEGVQRLSGFAADLAHDLRTPLNTLMMQTQVALSRPRGAEEYQALLASNLEEYERLSRMIENTLFLARVDNTQLGLHREMLDLHAELERIRDYFEILADDAGLTLRLNEVPPLALYVDPILFQRAVNNLLSNAIAYTPRGGSVNLAARAQGAWLHVEVSNTGPGIAPERLEHIFDRYYSGDAARSAARSSAGLGLAIVRAVMELHGGNVSVESAPGMPTSFTLRFPLQYEKCGSPD